MVTGDRKGLAGRQADNTGGGSGGGLTPRNRTESREETTEGGAREKTGGVRCDPGHSHEGDPWWSLWMEEP